jgi:hypothetical protein
VIVRYFPGWVAAPVLLTGLTGAEALWVLPRVNVWVSLLLSCVAVVSSLVRFVARRSGLGFWDFLV